MFAGNATIRGEKRLTVFNIRVHARIVRPEQRGGVVTSIAGRLIDGEINGVVRLRLFFMYVYAVIIRAAFSGATIVY